MKIVLLSMNFAPELTGIGKYSGELAQGLVDRGNQVVVVCAPPYYPDWRVRDGHAAARYRIERPAAGLTVCRCPVWVPSRPSGLKRLLHLLSFALSALPVLLALILWRPAAVLAVAPAFFCAPIAWLTARLSGARAWLHIQDLELDAAFELGILKGSLVRRAFALCERTVLRSFDTVSTISRPMARRLADKGVASERCRLLPNWVDLDHIYPTAGSPALRKALSIGADQTVFLFSGSMNRKQGLPVLFDALDLLKDQADIVLVLCGAGELREQTARASTGRGNVRLLDLQPSDRLNELLNMADVHLLPQLTGVADMVMPSKLAGMLASGRPVIAAAAAGTEIADVVAERGLLVKPESAEQFALAMATLAGDPALRRRLGANARQFVEQNLGQQVLIDGLAFDLDPSMGSRRGPGVVARADSAQSA